MSSWSVWRARFDERSERPLPEIPDLRWLPPRARLRLASTVARLQAGETGEGRIVGEVRRHGLGDGHLHACMARFVAEEGRHARILGMVVRALGGSERPHAWAARAFTGVRGAIGPRTKLLVLAAAETVAGPLYEALAQVAPHPSLAGAFGQIASDEALHLAFQVDVQRMLHPEGLRRRAFRWAWRAATDGAALVALAEHAPTLSALGADVGSVRRAMRGEALRLDAAMQAPGSPGALERCPEPAQREPGLVCGKGRPARAAA